MRTSRLVPSHSHVLAFGGPLVAFWVAHSSTSLSVGSRILVHSIAHSRERWLKTETGAGWVEGLAALEGLCSAWLDQRQDRTDRTVALW